MKESSASSQEKYFPLTEMKIKGGVALSSKGEGGSTELEAGMKKLRKSWAAPKKPVEPPKPVEAKKKRVPIPAYEPVAKSTVKEFVVKHFSE